MKKTIRLTLTAIAVTICSCTSFLDVEQLGKNTIEGFFSAPDGLKSAGLGLHRLLLDFYDANYIKMGELQGDKVDALRTNTNEAMLLVYDFESEEAHDAGYPYSVWNKGYEVLTNANEILLYAPKLLQKYPGEKDLVNKEMAYAYFARATMIFNLCNVYAQPYDFTADASHLGVVPINYIPGFNDALARKSMKECYSQILSDLQKALELFGNDNIEDVHYFSGLACEAMLARVYLYMKDYSKAAEYSKTVMGKVPLADRDEYVDMFRRAQKTPGEAIMRLNSYGAASSMKSACNPLSSQSIRAEQAFVDSFADNDIRKELFTFVGEKEDGIYEGKVYSAICKFLPFKTDESEIDNRRSDPFLLRVSEMYLIHAEALCLGSSKDLEAAAADVKALRARALGVDASEISLSYSSAEDLDRIVQEERAKELCFEGHRFFDLKRRHENVVRYEGTSSHTKVLEYPNYRYAQPIAHLEMQANESMVQNDGYKK